MTTRKEAAMNKRRILTWSGVLARFFTVQLAVQVATAAAGIIIVRWLTKPEYAYYAIATSIIFSATALTDCGVSVSLSALGGKIWQDNEAFGTLIASALSIRKWFVGVVVVGVFAVAPILLIRDGSSYLTSAAVTAVLAISLLVQFGIGLFRVVPQLRGNYRLLENTAMAAIVVRLALLGLLYFTILNAITVLVTNAIGMGVQLWLFERYASGEVNLKAKADKKMVSEILGIVRKQVPYEVYGAISGQISVLLISVFGNSARVADVGALSRLAMIFTATSGVLTNILMPRFARCQDPERLLPLYLKILLLYSGVVSSVTLIGWLFPNQLVSLLGHNYSNLGSECLLALSSYVSGAIASAVWGLNISRGWIVPAWIGVSLGILAQICGILIFDVRTVHGVLLMSLLANCIGLALHLVAGGYFFRSYQRTLIEASN
jgi:O-antigen/teichoic acid export membrane protein